jgi:hypothetical protein
MTWQSRLNPLQCQSANWHPHFGFLYSFRFLVFCTGRVHKMGPAQCKPMLRGKDGHLLPPPSLGPPPGWGKPHHVYIATSPEVPLTRVRRNRIVRPRNLAFHDTYATFFRDQAITQVVLGPLGILALCWKWPQDQKFANGGGEEIMALWPGCKGGQWPCY